MLTSAACSWMRHGRKISAPVVKFSILSAVNKKSPETRTLRGILNSSQQWSPGLVSPGPWLHAGLSTGSPSLSASAQGDADPLDSPSLPPEVDHFGSLSADMSSRRSFRKSSPAIRDLSVQEEDDVEEKDVGDKPSRRLKRTNTPYWYFSQCKKLIRENKLQQALDLFSTDMLQGERLQPEEMNYTVLIGGCGRAGQVKKAFRLYNDMKKRGLRPTDATYTALFNACAESPSKQAGLQQALKLEQELRCKNYPLSTITYHALLKAHAITNNLQACVHLLREMQQNGHAVRREAFHCLLMACLNDKEAGFRLVLQVWRQMLQLGIRPNSGNFNLLLRIARDCGIGNPALAAGILLRTDQTQRHKGGNNVTESRFQGVIDIDLLEKQLFIQADPVSDSQQGRHSEEQFQNEQDSSQLVPVRQNTNISLTVDLVADSSAPSLLDVFEGKRSSVVSLGSVDGPSDRLALIGGAKGFLEKMAAYGLSPDLRILTVLADLMEPGQTSLQLLLNVAKEHQVKLDVPFFNSVIRKAAKADDLDGVKAVLSVMRQRNVNMNVQTFGCLALGCKQQTDGLQLLKDMEEAGLRPNVHVFSALIGRASQRLDYVYLKTILKCMKDMEVWPNEVIIKQLEFAAQYPPNYDQYKSRNNYLVHIDGFRGYYQHWLKDMPAQDEKTELQPDPAVLQREDPDGLTGGQKNQRTAAPRHQPRNRNKTSSSSSAPSHHC